MDDKTTEMIAALAAKIGTTADHLWGVLVTQAPISGAIDLATVFVMVLVAIGLVRFVRGKTTPPAKTQDDAYPTAEWDGEGAFAAWTVTALYLFITFTVALSSAQGIVAAFFNPEYWALSTLLCAM